MPVNHATDFLLIIKIGLYSSQSSCTFALILFAQGVPDSDPTIVVESLTDTQGPCETTYLHLAVDPHGGIGILMAMAMAMAMAITMGLSTTGCM